MLTMTRRLGLGIVALLLTAPPASSPAHAADDNGLVGVYKCEGVNPDGRSYDGIVEVVERGGIFHLKWTLREGESFGFGIVTGGLFSVTYVAGRAPGLAVYVIEAGKPVKGQWVLAGVDGIYPETLTKMPADHKPIDSQPDKPRGDKKKEVQA